MKAVDYNYTLVKSFFGGAGKKVVVVVMNSRGVRERRSNVKQQKGVNGRTTYSSRREGVEKQHRAT